MTARYRALVDGRRGPGPRWKQPKPAAPPARSEVDHDYDPWDDGTDWSREDPPQCECRYCYCLNDVQIEGATCDMCLCGAHQG